MTTDQIIRRTDKNISGHIRLLEKHLGTVKKAMVWYEKKTGIFTVNCGIEIKFKRKSFMITGYNFQYPNCYFRLTPMRADVDLGVGAGGSVHVKF